MATALQAFTNHEFGTIRTITSGGQILFCGRDVAASALALRVLIALQAEQPPNR